ncbi:ABC-type transport system substrate-binding protein [Friedmanniella endophytica]|uniref:ABC-type transport system substrate-binding protein n=1 Tax=Microlunatus kandeliicorticis TaxID=1759536 RepID=A0A7W3P5N9_9ACTN|nr:ABC transporter substrate-binding protein [Microlunatus kandeliicorticis]MBA8794191.1 ABC-type transport system substrate-binding protein [Microlunatus kandeliicorticis]
MSVHRSRLTRLTRLSALAAAAVLVTAGCAVGTQDPDSSSGGSAAGVGGTLVYATGVPDHLTPGRQTVAFDQVMSLFAPLVEVDSSNNISYLQAKSVTSDDAQHWTITIRQGWTFQNGEPVTAKSYVDAWNATALSTNAFENSGQLAGIQGYTDLNPSKGKPKTTTMSGLKVVDDHTFTVTLSKPDSSFPLQLSQAQTGFYPMPESAYKDLKAYDQHPIGDGPFEMTGDFTPDKEFTVKKWADYKGSNVAKVDAVTFRPYADTNTAYTDVLAGNADIVFLPTGKMTSASKDFGDRLHSFDAPGIDYLGFPLWDKRFSDKRVRQAISMSIDRQAVNKAIYGGLYAPATALTPPTMQGTPTGVCGQYCTFDPAAAKQLLAEAGGWKGGTMKIVYPGGLSLDSLYKAYANQIRQNLGIPNVVATPTTDWSEYWQSLTDSTVAGPHFGHWGALYVSQQNTLRALFTTTGGCTLCTGKYHNDEVDAMLAKADAATSTDQAAQLYADTQKVIIGDFPVVPTFFDKYSYVVSDRVGQLPASAGSPVITGITLTKS